MFQVFPIYIKNKLTHKYISQHLHILAAALFNLINQNKLRSFRIYVNRLVRSISDGVPVRYYK